MSLVLRGRACKFAFLVTIVAAAHIALSAERAGIPDDFPRFIVPGHQKEMDSIRALYWLHYEHCGGPGATLWDDWMSSATLWPASERSEAMRNRWAAALQGRKLDEEGYVSTHQHPGQGHTDGWPFPLWIQSGGIGWHFTLKDQPYGTEFGLHAVDQKGFATRCTEDRGVTEANGWSLRLVKPGASVTTPEFAIGHEHAAFIKLFWRTQGLDGADPYLEWTTEESPEFGRERRVYFSAPPESRGFAYTMVPVHQSPNWNGKITRLRINFDNHRDASAEIRFIITAFDTRHDVNNANFIAACCTYFAWTRDLTFLRDNIQRMRLAMHYVTDVLGTRRFNCVKPPWPGHDGRAGFSVAGDGRKELHVGHGVGNNYWDLLPFGGEDCLASIYAHSAMNRLSDLEAEISAHPEWNLPANVYGQDPASLRQHAEQMRAFGQKRFWNQAAGRFVACIDLDGVAHDYGFTFLNLEAIYYGFASPEQAESILAWIAGSRIVERDTSQGADIYHWRFAPRATTRRNVDWYMWAWSAPEAIPWGQQVQDGGAVLGFSYHDLMARLMTLGPDDAASRLNEIATWFDDVQAAGGYREYYKDPSRGTLQGGNVPGGLGLDREFVESILPPQVMIYGFLGFVPSADGFVVKPRLPKDWPSLTITRVKFQDEVIDITAEHGRVDVRGLTPARWRVENLPESTGIRVWRLN